MTTFRESILSNLHLAARGIGIPLLLGMSSFVGLGSPAKVARAVASGDLPGDVNGDGVLTPEDARLVRDVLSGALDPSVDFERRAEVSGNGAVTAIDALLIELQAVGALEQWPLRYGDLDRDLAVGLPDSYRALSLALGRAHPSFTQGLLADVDGDAEVTFLDAWLIARYAVGWVKSFPVDPLPPTRETTPTGTPIKWTSTAGPTATAIPATISVTVTPPPGELPDLLVSSMKVELRTGGGCYIAPPVLGVRVVVANVGAADSTGFVVRLDGKEQRLDEGLPAGATTSLWFSGHDQFASVTAVVDFQEEVTESDESNNTRQEMLPVPTLPAPCTSTPTRTRTPTPTVTPTPPPGALPDLVITSMKIELETGGRCYLPPPVLGVRVAVANTGAGDAGGFTVWVGGQEQRIDGGLAAGSAGYVWFAGRDQYGATVAVVDYQGEVTESEEGNNTREEWLPVPTLPMPCTATPAEMPTSTPYPPSITITPTRTATRTPTPMPVVPTTATASRTPTGSIPSRTPTFTPLASTKTATPPS